jgi:hypothetical protein
MKRWIAVLVAGLSLGLAAGCKTPEERAMSQMEKQMRTQAEMMERMQKLMHDMERRMEKMDARD